MWNCDSCVNWPVSSSLTHGVLLLRNGTRNKPEQISSTSGCKKRCFLFPHSRIAKHAKRPCCLRWSQRSLNKLNLRWVLFVPPWLTTVNIDHSNFSSHFPVPNWREHRRCSQGVTRKMSLPRKMCGQLLYCFSKFLPGNSIPQLSAKVIFWSYLLICPSLKMTYSCCYVSVRDKSQPPKQTYHGMKEGERVFRNPVEEKQTKREREKEKNQHLKSLKMSLYLYRRIFDLLERSHNLPLSFSRTCTKWASFLPQINRSSTSNCQWQNQLSTWRNPMGKIWG